MSTNSLFNYPKQSMELARAQIESIYKNANLYLDDLEDMTVKRFELSIPKLNYLLSGKYFGPGSGFALGRLYNVYGPESIGKSALCYRVAGDIVEAGGRVAWVDAERSFDAEYALNFGVDASDKDSFHLIVPDYGEQAFEAIYSYASNKAVSLIVVDSVPALGTKKTQDNESEKNDVASLSLKLAQHLQKIIKPAADNQCSIMYINQLRENITSMGAFGKKYTGGNAKISWLLIQ